MKGSRYLLLPLCFLLVSGPFPETTISRLKERMAAGTDTLYVVNFWATWCGPCVAELPEFTRLDSAYRSKPVKVILLSQDFRKDIESRLIPFIEKRKITTEVMFLNELYDNEWIAKVDSLWQGNIPATWFFRNKDEKSLFIPRETSFHELDSVITDWGLPKH